MPKPPSLAQWVVIWACAAVVGVVLGSCTPTPAPTCPRVATYTPAEQAQAAAELATLPRDAVLRRVLADAKTLRDQLRSVCP